MRFDIILVLFHGSLKLFAILPKILAVVPNIRPIR
jgi:hypothetical protein